MNTKLLKQKILDLAIRGKLTQQLKSDGTAADLLTQISDERRKTRDERKGTRSKKSGVILSEAQSAKSKDLGQIIPLDKSEAPFEIPDNWEWVRLNQITELIEDCPHSTACDEGAGYPLIRTPNIGFGHLILEGVHRVSEDVYRRRNLRATPQPNDLIFAREAPAGNIAVIKDGQEVCLGQRTVLVRPLRNILCSYYLAYYILSSISQKRLVECSGGSTVAHVNLSVFRSYEVPLPPLAEQQRIVAKIEEAFAEIDAIEKNKELLKTHIKQTRQKILDLAIHGKLVPQNKSDEPASVLLERITRDNPHYEKIGVDNVPFEIPEKWCWCRLGDVLNIARGGSPRPIQDYLTNEKDGLNWIKIGDTEKGGKYIETVKEKIKPSGLSHTRAVKAGDFLLTNSMSFGRPYILKVDGCIHDGWLVLGNVEKSMIPDFLYFMLSSDFIYQSFAFAAAGSTVKNLKSETVQGTLFPLPPLAEQSRIVTKIEELFSTLDQMERNLV
ncbi:MAG: restriction endonuclease subunit S [Fibrobacter sp.]|nr:restriction endonuclease subunit S [Fibrobacter sp.]